MINPSSQRCEPFPLHMDALEFLRTAPPLPRGLLDVIEKVIRVVMVPFAFIVDLAINGVRVFVNAVISLGNCLKGPPKGACMANNTSLSEEFYSAIYRPFCRCSK